MENYKLCEMYYLSRPLDEDLEDEDLEQDCDLQNDCDKDEE